MPKTNTVAKTEAEKPEVAAKASEPKQTGETVAKKVDNPEAAPKAEKPEVAEKVEKPESGDKLEINAASIKVDGGEKYLLTPTSWPERSRTGLSIRAYCHQMARILTEKMPNGWTKHDFAMALNLGQQGGAEKGYRLPNNGGFGEEGVPNGKAKEHANWFCKSLYVESLAMIEENKKKEAAKNKTAQ